MHIRGLWNKYEKTCSDFSDIVKNTPLNKLRRENIFHMHRKGRLRSLKYFQAFIVIPIEPGPRKLARHSGNIGLQHMFRHLCSYFSCRYSEFARGISPCKHVLWETATTNTTEDEREINSAANEAIIPIADAIETIEVRGEMIGLKDGGSHLGRIDVAEIIENLIGEEEIALGDTMK